MPEIQIVDPIETDVALLDIETTEVSVEVSELLVVYVGTENLPGTVPTATNIAWCEVPSGAINGTNDTFILAHTPTGLELYLNGLKQTAGATNDFTLSTATITFNADCIPQSGDIIEATYRY